MSNELFTDLVRGLLIGTGGVILGMAFQVSIAYGEKAIRGKFKFRMPTHVAMVSLSYCLLVIVASGTQLELLLEDAGLSWRIPVTTFAYILGILALRLVLMEMVERRSRLHLRRQTDPFHRTGDPSTTRSGS